MGGSAFRVAWFGRMQCSLPTDTAPRTRAPKNAVQSLASAPPTAWRPSLVVTRLIDDVLGGAWAPVGVIARQPAILVPALVRVPAAQVLTLQPWNAADLALLATVALFVGTLPTVVHMVDVAPKSLQMVLWLDPTLPLASAQVQRVAACLAPDGMLAIAVADMAGPMAMVAVLHLRHALRRAGWHISQTGGFLGPRALAWSVCARLALAAGRPERYDRYHAAMRAAYAESWPLALLCRATVVLAQRTGPPAGTDGFSSC